MKESPLNHELLDWKENIHTAEQLTLADLNNDHLQLLFIPKPEVPYDEDLVVKQNKCIFFIFMCVCLNFIYVITILIFV